MNGDLQQMLFRNGRRLYSRVTSHLPCESKTGHGTGLADFAASAFQYLTAVSIERVTASRPQNAR